jgi:hypothetical protein
MSVGPVIVIFVLMGLAAMAIPLAVMAAAMRGGPNLARIVRVVAGAAIVLAAVWVGLAVFSLGSSATTVTVPVSVTPVKVPAGFTFDGPTAAITGGGFDRVTVSATGLPLATRLVLTAATVLSAGTAVAVALVVLRLVRSTGEGDPFALGSRALVTTGWIAMIGGTLATWVGNIGEWFASMDLFWLHGWSAVGDHGDIGQLSELGWPDAAQLRLDLPWAPVAIGLILALLAGIFRHGARLRDDTVGLV